MDLSKSFDSIPQNFLLEKMHAYLNRFCRILLFVFQKTQIKCEDKQYTQCSPNPIYLGIPQGSLLGPLLFNLSKIDLLNFANDNTINTAKNTIT